MISRITLAGIKSFIRKVDVPCGPLTIISGANSAGKSTILQVLLLLKQTLESTPADSSLRLSGALANLGTASIASTASSHIGVQYDGHTMSLELDSDADRDGDKLFIKALAVDEKHAFLSSSTEEALFDFQTDHLLEGDIYDFRDHWLVMRGITPIAAIRRVDGFSTEQRNSVDAYVTRYLVGTLTDLLESGDIEVHGYEERQWRATALRYLRQMELAHGVRVMREIGSVAEETAERVGLTDQLTSLLSQSDADLVSDIGQLLDLEHFGESLSALVSRSGVQSFELIEDAPELDALSVRSLTENVFYLGPLREDPQLIHEDLVLEDVSEIGPKGTHMVSYLYYRGQDIIGARLPDNLQDGNDEIRRMPLIEAINVWLQYLGIGSEVAVEQRQPYGLTIGLTSQPGGPVQLLTNVGVGVSQVLPILTVGLAAKSGQTLVYEQPELHLHPAVQSRLADFFLLLAASNVQVIVETHSEHLINRARLYVARRRLKPDALHIAFVTRDEYGSSVQAINVDDDGYLETWPDGFFDETEKTLLELLGDNGQ